MADLGRPSFTSGNWMVTEGNEEAFVESWNLVAAWCLEHRARRAVVSPHPGRGQPSPLRVVRRVGRARRHHGLALSPEFLRLFRKAQSLCDTFSGSDYEVALAAVAAE